MKAQILTIGLLFLLGAGVQAQDTTQTAEKPRMVIRYVDGKWDTTYVEKKAPELKKDSASEAPTSEIESDLKAGIEEFKRELREVKPKKKKVDKSLFLVDIGSNAFMQNGSMNLNGSNLSLRTENGFSSSIGWGFTFARSENLIAQKLRLMYGLGFEFNNYRLRDDSVLSVARDTVGFLAPVNAGLTRNSLHANWINIPVMLHFTTNPYRRSKAFNISAGAELGLRIGNLESRQRYDLGNDIYQEVSTKGPQNTNPVKMSLVARVGYGGMDVFVRYGLTEMFRQNVGTNPNARPVMAGVSFRM
jgi:hypothetical protein